MERRRFMGAFAAAPFMAWLGISMAEAAFGATGNVPQMQTPFPPQVPGGMPPGPGQWPGNGPQFPSVKFDKHVMLEQNQKNIRKDVHLLYDLASKLRKQVDKTDSSEILSVDMIRTADQIEKLAKHIRNLARG